MEEPKLSSNEQDLVDRAPEGVVGGITTLRKAVVNALNKVLLVGAWLGP